MWLIREERIHIIAVETISGAIAANICSNFEVSNENWLAEWAIKKTNQLWILHMCICNQGTFCKGVTIEVNKKVSLYRKWHFILFVSISDLNKIPKIYVYNNPNNSFQSPFVSIQ